MDNKLNVLWICSDQQRTDTLGCYGNGIVNTPNIDALAKSGTLFEKAYTQCPVCAPSRGSFLTGRYPRTCGPRQNGQDIDEREITLPRILKDNGYVCGLSGKLHISACSPSVCPGTERRIDDGYDYFAWSHHPSGFRGGWPLNGYTLWLESMGVKFRKSAFPECSAVEYGMPEEYHQTKWCTDRALDFMEGCRLAGKPWLFSVNYYDPHHPFDPPKEYLDRYLSRLDEIPAPSYIPGELENKPSFQMKDHLGAYDTPGQYAFDKFSEKDHKYIRAAYYAMCDLIDHQAGRLIGYLKKSGQLENTIIIYMSDHGEHLGDHGMYLKGPCFYENNVNVPLIISCPGTIPSKRISSLAELVDIAPTLLDYSGIERPEGMQGYSMRSLISGECETLRKSAYSEYYNCNINHRDPKAFCTMVTNGRYKLIKVHASPDGIPVDPAKYNAAGELYDLVNDPGEHYNLYDDPGYTGIKCEMLALLCDRMAQTCDPLPHRKASW